MQAFYPNGQTIEDIDEFVRFYSQCYYLSNSKFAEDKIDSLLEENREFTEQDVMLILRWKFDRIDHKQSGVHGKSGDRIEAGAVIGEV
ncbi:MAG: hypothetical protein II705_06175 [Clostridia bacterium]|nr:hypothetical protein [Clostridia bacterium]